MTNSKIPTILAILILLIGLASAVFILQQAQTFRLGANPTFSPQNVKISNIKDTSFAVSWTTDAPTIGLIEYLDTKSSVTPLTKVHWLQVFNLHQATTYSFNINSGGAIYDNAGKSWQVTTTASQVTSSSLTSGKILKSNGMPAKNALVFVKLDTNQLYSVLTSEEGNWVISLPNLSESSIIDISVQSDLNQTAHAKINLQAANPTPIITLGKNYDFTSKDQTSNIEIPKVNIDLP